MSRDFIVNTKSCGTIIKRTRTPILSDYAKNLEKLKLPAAHSMQDMESSWSQLEHRFDAWVSFYTVSLEDGPSPKSIFLRANPLASNSAFNSSLILEAFKRSLLYLLWSGSSRFDGFMIYFAIFSFTKIQGRHPVVIKSIPCCCQSSWLKMPSTNSFVFQYILPLYIVTTYRQNLTFPSLSAQFFSFFSLFINNRRYPEEPYSRVFSVITWTTYKNTVNYDRRCSTRVKWCGSICFVYIHATPHMADNNRRQAVSHVSETKRSTDSTFFREMNICGECDLMETTYCFFQPINILHKMPSVQDFLILLVVVLLLMILYFLMEMNRAVQHRIMEHNNEQREIRRPEFIRNMEGRRRRDNENHCVPHNRNRPTENDERQG